MDEFRKILLLILIGIGWVFIVNEIRKDWNRIKNKKKLRNENNGNLG
jgi:hypothetical protein